MPRPMDHRTPHAAVSCNSGPFYNINICFLFEYLNPPILRSEAWDRIELLSYPNVICAGHPQRVILKPVLCPVDQLC